MGHQNYFSAVDSAAAVSSPEPKSSLEEDKRSMFSQKDRDHAGRKSLQDRCKQRGNDDPMLRALRATKLPLTVPLRSKTVKLNLNKSTPSLKNVSGRRPYCVLLKNGSRLIKCFAMIIEKIVWLSMLVTDPCLIS